ncbi:MAG: hypothetical protein LBC70_03275 [Chitinispirillales bacterium]|jgi:hypothetical protein|nr:hypothetical protein [Chitinispirillales bacterium]
MPHESPPIVVLGIISTTVDEHDVSIVAVQKAGGGAAFGFPMPSDAAAQLVVGKAYRRHFIEYWHDDDGKEIAVDRGDIG